MRPARANARKARFLQTPLVEPPHVFLEQVGPAHENGFRHRCWRRTTFLGRGFRIAALMRWESPVRDASHGKDAPACPAETIIRVYRAETGSF